MTFFGAGYHLVDQRAQNSFDPFVAHGTDRVLRASIIVEIRDQSAADRTQRRTGSLSSKAASKIDDASTAYM